MLESGSSFYEEYVQERNIDFEIIKYSDTHSEITSFPYNIKVPTSEIGITQLFVGKDQPLADIYHVKWSAGANKSLVQIFLSGIACYITEEGYILTGRLAPQTLSTSGKIDRIFLQTPTVLGFQRQAHGEYKNIPISDKIKIRFHFRRIKASLDYVWETISNYLPTYTNLVSILTNDV
jgi:hypothetical protein